MVQMEYCARAAGTRRNRQGGYPPCPVGTYGAKFPSAGQEEIMKKWKQRLFSLLLCGAMLVSLCVPVEAADVVDSGRFPGVGGNVP